MKITLNKKLFEASENKKKEADKKKASKPKEAESSTESEESESEPTSSIDSGSDYVKKLILLFKKTGDVDPDIKYEKSSTNGIETVSFNTKKDGRNYTVKLKNTKLEDESGKVAVNKNFFRFYKIIDGESKAMSGNFLEVDDFQEFAESVVSYVDVLDDAKRMSKLIPEAEKEIDSGVSQQKQSAPEPTQPREIEKAFSGLPTTPDEGKPLPKEVSKPAELTNDVDKQLEKSFSDFIEKLKSEPNITIDNENSREKTVFFTNGTQKNRVRIEKTKDGKIVAKYGDRKSPTTTEIENNDFSEVFSNIGINKKSENKPKETPVEPSPKPFDAKSEFAKMFGSDKNRKKVEPVSKPNAAPTAPAVTTTPKKPSDVTTQQNKKPNISTPLANPVVVNKSPEKNKETPVPKKAEVLKPVPTPVPSSVVEPKKQEDKPIASAVQAADDSVNVKPEVPNEPSKVEPEIANSQQIDVVEPSAEKSEPPPVNVPNPVVDKEIETAKNPVSKTPSEKDIKDQISGKDPYVLDRAKQNKNKLSNISNTDFDKFLSEPISLGKKDRVDQKTNLYSRTVYLNKDKVQHIFNLNFIEANKTLFEAVETSLLQQVIKKIINSLLALKTKEVVITDFENAELDGLYAPGDMLASVYVKTEKNPAVIHIQKIPTKISSNQISEIAVLISRKLEEIASKSVGTQDTISKISFLTTLVKSEKQPEQDLSGNTNVGRKLKSPAVPQSPLSANPNVADDYKLDPNNSGVQRMAKQLGISGGDTVPNNKQGIPESQVYKTKAVFELYSPVMAESDLTTDKISASPSFKIRDAKFRGLINNAFYLEESNSLVFNLMPSQSKGFEVVTSKDSAFVLTANNGERKYFSAQDGYKILAKDKTGKLVPVSNIDNAGMLYYVIINSFPVVLESDFVPPNDPEQENKKAEVVSTIPKTVPNKNVSSDATAVGKQKGIQPDTSPISTDPTQIAQIPNQAKSVEAPKQKVNTIDTMSALLQFRRAVLGHIQKNLNAFLELYPKSGKALEKWLIDSGLVQVRTPVPSQQSQQQTNAPTSTPVDPTTKPPEKKRGRPPKNVNQITEATQPKIWRKPPENNWQNPNDKPLSVRSTNLRKQDYFGPGQNRKLEKDTIMFATKEQDIIDGVNDVFKHFVDKSLTKQPDLTPYIEKLQNRKFFPIKVEKLQDNIFFVKSDSSDKLFLIAPVGILYERVKNIYETKSSTKDSRVLKYTKLASIPVDRANSSMSVVENQIQKGICVVSNEEYKK